MSGLAGVASPTVCEAFVGVTGVMGSAGSNFQPLFDGPVPSSQSSQTFFEVLKLLSIRSLGWSG